MVATVLIRRLTGAGPSATDITSINSRANAEDAHSTAGTTNPIVVPTSSTNNSYWVVTRLDATVAAATNLTNIKVYWPSSNTAGTGVTYRAALGSAYTQATGTAGTSGDLLNSTNYGSGNLGTNAAGTDNAVDTDPFTNHPSGTPFAPSGSQASTGQFGVRHLYQAVIATTASPGPTTAQTITWTYDET